MNVVAVTFNVAVTMKVVPYPFSHVESTLNGAWKTAFDAVEFEVPTAATVIAVVNTQITSKIDMESSFCVVLYKIANLLCKDNSPQVSEHSFP